MRPLATALMIVGLGVLTQCSGNPPATTTFACGTMLCTAASEYCLDAQPAGLPETFTCTSFPAGGCIGNPCQSCLSGTPNLIRCTPETVGPSTTATVIVSN